MINCPRCKKPFGNEVELYSHLRDVHKISQNEAKKMSGWFEPKKETPDGDLKAIEHQVAALKIQKQKEYSETLTAPLVLPPPKREEIKVPAGWVHGSDNSFIFERTLGTVHTSSNAITKVLKGKVTNNHGELVLFRLDKDTSELTLLQEKASTLESRLAALVVDDPAFSNVASELHQTRKRIRELNKSLKAEQSTELILEDYFYGQAESQECQDFQEKFMQQVMAECDRVAKSSKNESDEHE